MPLSDFKPLLTKAQLLFVGLGAKRTGISSPFRNACLQKTPAASA